MQTTDRRAHFDARGTQRDTHPYRGGVSVPLLTTSERDMYGTRYGTPLSVERDTYGTLYGTPTGTPPKTPTGQDTGHVPAFRTPRHARGTAPGHVNGTRPNGLRDTNGTPYGTRNGTPPEGGAR